MYNKISYIKKLYITFIIFNNDTTDRKFTKALKVTKESGTRLDFCRGKIGCNLAKEDETRKCRVACIHF